MNYNMKYFFHRGTMVNFFLPLLEGVRGRLFIILLLSALSMTMVAKEIEKFAAASDIAAVTVNGKSFIVHEQNQVPSWNAAPNSSALPGGTSKAISSAARMIALKNLMITGTLSEGITLKSIQITTSDKRAKVTFFADRNCTKPLNLNGETVKAGEQVYYVKVLTPNGSSYQVYTLSIMGLNNANHAQYYKYGEPTFVADSYHTWIWALQHAKPGQRIAVTRIEQYLYKDGEYQFRPQIENKQDLVIRSFSGCNEDLILHGHGFHKGSYSDGLPHDELFIVTGTKTKNIVVYGITVQESTANGFKLNGYGEENITFDNCRTIDVCERAFKGSGPRIDGKFTRARNISIINCRFENTQVPVESDHMAEFTGDYIGGIDVMNLSGLTIAGNTFKNIVGKNGGGRGGIFIWGQDGTKDVLIENNIFINCDRGIALGNNSGQPAGNTAGGFYVNNGVVRNNFIYNSSGELIELNRTYNVKIYNNTLWRANTSRRGIRDSGGTENISHNVSIINNIICGAVNELPRGNNIDIRHNIFSTSNPSDIVPGTGNTMLTIPEDFFMDAANGDFRLRESSFQAFKKGIPLPEVETDFFGTPRGAIPDLGAHQYIKPIINVLSMNNIPEAANTAEKFNAASDIVAVTVNGRRFKVQEQNHVPQWNAEAICNDVPGSRSLPDDKNAKMVELKNLMITGTLAAGLPLNDIVITTASEGATATFFKDRNCTLPYAVTGEPVKSGEQVIYVKVLSPDRSSFQVYTLSIMGLSILNHAQYYKYGEPTFVADSYNTWIWALHNAQPGQRIALTKIEQLLCKPGEYLFRPQVEDKQDLVLRSLSGNYEDFILRGHGFHKGIYGNGKGVPRDVLFLVARENTKNITIYGITVQESTTHGFMIGGYGEENIIFDNCRTIDVNERSFKGGWGPGEMPGRKFTRSKNIMVINCRFENTQVPLESDHMDEFNADYIGGLDVMNISGLTVSGNIFKNIVGKNNNGRGAIFIWGQDGDEDVLIENNIIMNCNKGIALGNPSGDPTGNTVGGFYINGAIVRNNFIYNATWDMMELNRLNNVKIYNNTLWRADASRRGIRDSGIGASTSHNISIINNIIFGAIDQLPRGNNIDIRHNIFCFNEPSGKVPGEGNTTVNLINSENLFINAPIGDFRLRASSTQALGKGIPLAEAATDFFGTPRGDTPDLGAHQYIEPSQ